MSWEKKKSACCDQEHPSGLAGWGQQGIRTQEGLDGLASVPGSFFCGTVVPASQPPTRNAILRYATSADNGSAGSFLKYRGFSTVIWLGVQASA